MQQLFLNSYSKKFNRSKYSKLKIDIYNMKNLRQIINEAEKSKLQKEYEDYFTAKLKEYGVESPADLSEEDKKKFFDEIQKGWTEGKGEKTNESSHEEEEEEKEKVEPKVKKDGEVADKENKKNKEDYDDEEEEEVNEANKFVVVDDEVADISITKSKDGTFEITQSGKTIYLSKPAFAQISGFIS